MNQTYLNPIDHKLDVVRQRITHLIIPYSSHAHSLPLDLEYLARHTTN